MAAASDALVSCAHNPDFAAVCSFLDQFGDKFGIVFPSFYDLQQLIECTTQISQVIIELHVKLLRRLKRSASMDRWENAIVKFAQTYSQPDAWELERFGYLKANLNVKIRLLKNLLETQFDKNPKFKAEINALSSQELRLQPLGRDRHGYRYWHLLDDDCNLRVYREDMDDETWELVASDKTSMLKLIESLASEANQITPPEATPEDSNSQDFLDTGQKSPQQLSQKTLVINPILSATDTDAYRGPANALPPSETNASSRGAETSLNPEEPIPPEDENVPAVLSEAVEAPLLVVRGEGSGAECEAGNPGLEDEESNPESQEEKEGEIKELESNEGGVVSSSNDSTRSEKEESGTIEGEEHQVREPATEKVLEASVESSAGASTESEIQDKAELGEDLKDDSTAVLTEESKSGAEGNNYGSVELESKGLIQQDDKEDKPENLFTTVRNVELEKRDFTQMDVKEEKKENSESAEQISLVQGSSDSLTVSKIGDAEENVVQSHAVQSDKSTQEIAGKKDQEEFKNIIITEEPKSNGQTAVDDQTQEENLTPCDPEIKAEDESNDPKCIGTNIVSSAGLSPAQHTHIDEKTDVMSPCSLQADVKVEVNVTEMAIDNAVGSPEQNSPSQLLDQQKTLTVSELENQSEFQKTKLEDKSGDRSIVEQTSLVDNSSATSRSIKGESLMEQDADHVKKEEKDTTESTDPVAEQLRVPEQMEVLVTDKLQTCVKEEFAVLGTINEEPDERKTSRESNRVSEPCLPVENSSIIKEELNLELKKQSDNSEDSPSGSMKNSVDNQETKKVATPEENLPEGEPVTSTKEKSEITAPSSSTAQGETEHVELKLPEVGEKSPVQEVPESDLDVKQNDTQTLPASADSEVPNENSDVKLLSTDNLPVPEVVSTPQDTLLDSRNGVDLAKTFNSHVTDQDPKQDKQLPKVEVTENINLHETKIGVENDTCVSGQSESNPCQDETESERKEIQPNEKPEPLCMPKLVSEVSNSHPETETSVESTERTEYVQQVEPKVEPVLREKPIEHLSETAVPIRETGLIDSKATTSNYTVEVPQDAHNAREINLKIETTPVVPQTNSEISHTAADQSEEPCVKAEEGLSESRDENNMQPAEAVVKQEKLTSEATSEHSVRNESDSEAREMVAKSPVIEATDTKDEILESEAHVAEDLITNTKSELGDFNAEDPPSSVEPSNCEKENVAKESVHLLSSSLLESKPSESELKAPRAVVREVDADNGIKSQANVFVSQGKSNNESPKFLEDQKPAEVVQSSEDPIVKEAADSPEGSVKDENEEPSSCVEPLPEMEKSSSVAEEESSKLIIVAQRAEVPEHQIHDNKDLAGESDSVLTPEKNEEKEVSQDSRNSEVLPAVEVEEIKEYEGFYNETSNSSSNSLHIAAGDSLPPSPTKNDEFFNGPTEPSPGSTSSNENSKSNLISKQEDSGPKAAPEEAPLLAALATPPNLEEDKSNMRPDPPFCRSPEIHSENATTDSKFREMVEKFQADGDEARLPNNVAAVESSQKTSSSGMTENSPSKGMSLTSFSMDYDGETVTPLQETLALLKQNEKKKEIDKEGTCEENKEPVLQKRRGRRSTKRLTADALVMLNASEEAAKEASPRGCRQSLRIAKLKEKEDDERRAVEEERLKRLKDEFERREKRRQERDARKVRMEEKAKKKDQQGPKKKRKRSSEEDSDFSAGEKKTKKKKKKNTPWDSSDSSSESSSSEDDLEALQHAAEEEEELVFKSDHEFSPESDIGEEEAAPTRHARTARKKITKKKAELIGEDEEAEEDQEEEEEEEVDESSCQKCGQGDNPEWILLCDNCDGGWHVSCLKPALMMIPAGDWYCPPCEHAMLMEKLQERLEAYEYLLQQRDADIKAKEELEAAAKLAAAEEETDDLDRKENDEGEDLEEEEEKEGGKKKKKKSKSDEEESAPDEGEEEEDEDESESGEEEESAISEEKSEEEGEEPVYRLRRSAQQPAYNFKAYDEMIKSAIQDDDQEEEKADDIGNQKEGDKESTPNAVSVVAPPPVSKGKGPRSDEDSDEDFSRLVRRKKKARKLNDLDATSSDDSKDTDFKGSSASEDDEDEWEAEEDSDDDFIVDESDESDVVVFKGRDRRKAEPSVRRSTRKSAPRYKMDSDSDTSEESGGGAWSSGDSSESSSDASWGGGRKRRKITKKPAPVKKPPVKKTPAPKKKPANTAQKRGRRKTQSDSDSDEESFKPRGKKTKATPRQEPEEDSAASRRTRGKKVSYRALISSEDSISEDEPPKRPPPERKSIRPPVATASVVAPPPVPRLAAPPSPSPSQADEDEDLHLSAAEAIAEEEAEAGRADSPWDDQDAVLPSSQTVASLPDDLDPSGTSSSAGLGSDLPIPVTMDNTVIQHALSALATPPTVLPTIPAGLPMPVLTQATPVHIPRTLDVQRMLHDPPPPASLSPKLNRMPPEMHVSRLIQQTPPTPATAINPLALINSLPPEEVSSLRKLDLLAASDLSKARDDPHLKMEIPHAVQGSSPYPVVKPAPLLADPNPRSFLNVIKVPDPRGGAPSNRLPPVMPPLYTGSPKASPLPEGVIRPSPYIPPPPYSVEPRPYAAAPAPSSPHPSHAQPPSHPPNQFLPQPYPGYGPPRLPYAPPPRPYPYPMHPYIRTPGFQHAGFPTAFATEEERRIFRVAQPPREYVFERGDPTLSSAPPPALPALEEPQPKDTPPSSVANPAPSETEESEFGGLVSYFSSQQEDFDS